MDGQQDSWKREVMMFVHDSPGKFAANGGAAPELLLFQLEDAQEFVAQARSAIDLWSGSCFVSWLMARALKAVTDDISMEAVLYPSLKADGALDTPRRGLSVLPDRFLAVVPAGQGKALAEKAQAALRAELARVGDAVMMKSWDKASWDAQLKRFPRIVWATHTWQKDADWTANCVALGDKLAARRNTYDFAAWPLKSNGRKDSLSGIEDAIAEEDGKPYGAMNLIRRYWWRSGLSEKTFRRYSGYFAVLAITGDGMAKGAKEFTPALHLKQSEALARFATDRVRQSMERFGGEMLYARGGEMLLLVPAAEAITCAQQLRGSFRTEVGGDMVCGIAMGHSMVSPFQMLLREAYRVRDAAKRQQASAPMSVVIHKRFGEIIEWGCIWNSVALEMMDTVAKLSKAKRISNRFPYVLSQLLQPYGLESPIFSAPVILAEFMHVVSRQGKGLGDELFGMATRYLCENPKGKVQDFINLFMVGNFLNRI